MMIIGVGHAGCRQFDSFEELQDSPLLREFTNVLVGTDIDILSVNADFQAYARNSERERFDELDRMERLNGRVHLERLAELEELDAWDEQDRLDETLGSIH